jgi:hypothetical protein
MRQKHNIQLPNFDIPSSRVIWFRWRCLIAKSKPPSLGFMMITSNQWMKPTAGSCEQVEGKSMKYEVKTKLGFACSGLSLFG